MKIIREEKSSDDRSAAFLIEEARRLGRLQHPNIPPIYDAGLDKHGRVFYTTKTVEGMTLRFVLDQLESGRTGTLLHFTLRRLLNVFHKVCDAFAFAHTRGITHGGLKAEDVILGDFGEVYVTNWRLPRTPGSLQSADPHDDIAALGRLLFEIATLEPPSEAALSAPSNAANKRMAKDAKKPANAVQQGHYRGGGKVVQMLVAVSKRAIDKKALDRFHSVKEFQMRVDAFKDTFEDPVHITLRRLFRQWLQKHKLAIIVTVFLVFVAVMLAIPSVRHAITGKPAAKSLGESDRMELTKPLPSQH
jgi:serine/threonine protein kinase